MRVALTGLFIGTIVLALCAPAAAQPQIKRETARPIESVEGVDLYNAYCAVCHGKDGKGHGPAAPALKVMPPDLTTLAKRSGGKFSVTDVTESISGQGKPMAAHGSAEMPVWGPVFRAFAGDDAGRTLRLTNLVRYLESMQQK
jgi:mono/diheme cytochrome c family protein